MRCDDSLHTEFSDKNAELSSQVHWHFFPDELAPASKHCIEFSLEAFTSLHPTVIFDACEQISTPCNRSWNCVISGILLLAFLYIRVCIFEGLPDGSVSQNDRV